MGKDLKYKKIEKILSNTGLEQNEVVVYLGALKVGNMPASVIANKVGMPRTTVRYICEQLIKKQLMIGSNKGNTKYFTTEHPNKLKVLLQVKKNAIEEKEFEMDSIMQDLIEMQNPYISLPKVTYYEGIDGVKKVLWDSLDAKEIVDSFTDVDLVIKHASELNKEYTEERKRLKLKKRAIYSNSQETKEYIQNIYKNNQEELSQIKFLDSKLHKLYISFMIYDKKISYITIKEGNFFGVIIENEDIYNFHKTTFDLIWNKLNS